MVSAFYNIKKDRYAQEIAPLEETLDYANCLVEASLTLLCLPL
jgi:hypothetical protein